MTPLACPACGQPLQRIDRRYRDGEQLRLTKGVEHQQIPNQAPRLKCPCGHVTILLEGRR